MKEILTKIDSPDGEFHNGDPATGTQGTRVTAEWLNAVQERVLDFGIEVRYLLAKAAMTPDPQKQTQLYEAIQKIIDNNRKRASLTIYGETKLYSGNDSESEEMAATPKAVKGLKALIDALTSNLTNYIPNSKKNNGVNSISSDTVATSYAVKTAYDKGVEAKTAADNAQKSANAAQSTANAKQSPATTLAGYGIADFVVKSLSNENLNNINTSGLYGQPANANATIALNYPETQAGTLYVSLSAYGVQQEYTTYSSKNKYVRGKSDGSMGWGAWKRIDGADWSEVRNKPVQATRWPTWSEVTSKPTNLVYSSSFSATGGTSNYVSRDGSGDIVARLFRSTYNDQSNISGAIAFRVNNSTDNYTRYCNSPAAVRSWLGLHASATRAASWSEITGKPTTAAGLGVNDFDARVTNLFTYQKVGNFEIRKYPDGTMIQIYIMKQYEVRDWIEKKFNWAQAFVGVPSIFTDVFSSFNGSNTFGVTVLTKSTNATCYYWEYEVGGAINQGNVSLQFFAIGRWK